MSEKLSFEAEISTVWSDDSDGESNDDAVGPWGYYVWVVRLGFRSGSIPTSSNSMGKTGARHLRNGFDPGVPR